MTETSEAPIAYPEVDPDEGDDQQRHDNHTAAEASERAKKARGG